MTIKILSIDGGGIRGLIPALILNEIEQRTGKKTSELFDLLAGTSTGGIIAIGLNVTDPHTGKPYAAQKIAGLYEDNGAKIFQKKHLIPAVGALLDESYYHQGLEEVLESYFGNADLKSTPAELLITSYDIEHRKPFYFLSREAKLNPHQENFHLRDIARATSAAPTYFEPHPLSNHHYKHLALVDGGVFANNPALLAYSEAINIKRWRDYQAEQSPYAQTRSIDAGASNSRDFSAGLPEYLAPDQAPDFFMLSLGTGQCRQSYPYSEAKDWGLVGWARPMLDILMQGVSESVDYQMQYILPPTRDGRKHYFRLSPDIPAENTEMSDVSAANMQALKDIASEFIQRQSSTIDEICAALTR